jgi:hypothetical protein
VAYNVARRTSEIGIRMALGAQRGRLVCMVLREVLMLGRDWNRGERAGGAGGIEAGGIVSIRDETERSWALAAAEATLLVAARVAGYLPARKASWIDPMVALRHE